MRKIFLIALLLFSFASLHAQEETIVVEWPEQYYAPYVYMAAYPVYQLAPTAEATGVRFFTLAFVLGGASCEARWSGTAPLDSSYIYNFLQTDLPALREMGGDVIISFGGATGTELAMACEDPESLAEQYGRVIEIYDVRYLDFDIEGDDMRDPAAIERRSEAIALVQAENAAEGREITVSYTLPVLPTGLTEEGLAVLESAIEHGVRVDVVNIMSMNFGVDFQDASMGENNLEAANSLFAQLQTLYPEKTEEEIWGMIGLTPMLGLNDRGGDIFMLEDAILVTEFVAETGIRMISNWSLDRDQPCEFVDALANDCSGIPQEPFDFSTIFNSITGESPQFQPD